MWVPFRLHDEFMQQYARMNRYLYSFLLRTIPDWNNLNIENLSNCNLDFLKDYLSSYS